MNRGISGALFPAGPSLPHFPCLFSQSLPSQNPILKNITDYLIEEVSAEEEELLGSSGGPPPEEPPKEGNPAEINVERDEKLIKVPTTADGHRVWGHGPQAKVGNLCLPILSGFGQTPPLFAHRALPGLL